MDETRYNQDREMVSEAVRVSGDPRKPPSARKNHLPVIAIPAVIALVFILYIIGWSLYASLLDYNVRDGLGSRFVGMEHYLEVLYDDWMMPALGNTILMRLTNLVICAGLSALMCAGYRKMKNPGKILAAACLWRDYAIGFDRKRPGVPGGHRPADRRDLLLYCRAFPLAG